MATLTLNDEQVLELVRQLPDERRAWLLQQLIKEEWPAWERLSAYGADKARAFASMRGLSWDTMADTERELLIDDILHEDQ